MCQSLAGGGYSYDDVRDAIKRAGINVSGKVDVEEFLEVVAKLKDSEGQKSSVTMEDKLGRRRTVMMGKQAGTAHTIDEEEKTEFVHHINLVLNGDPHLKGRIPVNPKTMQIFDEVRDGIILSKLINDSVPGTIDERVLNLKGGDTFKMTENNNLVINSAKAIGCQVINIGAQDLMEGREHLILGLIWQIMKIGLLAKVDIKQNPNLYRLLESGEALEDFLKLPPDQILLRWFNYHLREAGCKRRITNFGPDVKDGEGYTYLLNQLASDKCSLDPLNQADLYKRAEMILNNAEKIGCRKYLSAKTLTNGNPRLNLAFVANLFNTLPGLAPVEMEEIPEVEYDYENDREAKAFALWLNSLGVEPFINRLYDDLVDGNVLLQVLDKIHPGLVNWRHVNRPKGGATVSRFKQLENTNLCISLGKQLRYSLVGIQGADITDMNRTLVLAYVWQVMRDNIVFTLKNLTQKGKEVNEEDILKWANETVKRGGKTGRISSFKDSSLKSGIFLLDVMSGMKSDAVDYALVSNDHRLNANYAISIARKLGATIFVTPDDILEVKPKMVCLFNLRLINVCGV